MNPLSTDKLAALIEQKLRVLTQLRDVGMQQIELVESGDTTNLLKLLAAKQHLIGALQAAEGELAPFRDEDPEGRQWPTAEARTRCAAQAEECNHLLSQVVQLEKQSEDQMIARRDQVASQLHQVNSASRASGAYAAHQAHKTSPNKPQIASPRLGARLETPSGAPFAGGLDLVSGT